MNDRSVPPEGVEIHRTGDDVVANHFATEADALQWLVEAIALELDCEGTVDDPIEFLGSRVIRLDAHVRFQCRCVRSELSKQHSALLVGDVYLYGETEKGSRFILNTERIVSMLNTEGLGFSGTCTRNIAH